MLNFGMVGRPNFFVSFVSWIRRVKHCAPHGLALRLSGDSRLPDLLDLLLERLLDLRRLELFLPLLR